MTGRKDALERPASSREGQAKLPACGLKSRRPNDLCTSIQGTLVRQGRRAVWMPGNARPHGLPRVSRPPVQPHLCARGFCTPASRGTCKQEPVLQPPPRGEPNKSPHLATHRQVQVESAVSNKRRGTTEVESRSPVTRSAARALRNFGRHAGLNSSLPRTGSIRGDDRRQDSVDQGQPSDPDTQKQQAQL